MGLLSGCGRPDFWTTPDALNWSPAAELVAGDPSSERAYRLRTGDQIQLRFQFYNDLNDAVTIGPDGRIVLQLVGSVPVGGLTPPQANVLLNRLYRKIVKQPNLSVTVSTYSLQQIYVDGQVGSPGLIRSTLPLTASRAIAQAGGLKLGTARTQQVLLLRRTAEGQVAYFQLDFGNGVPAIDQDPVLQSGDVLYVPETPIASVANFFSNNILKIIPYNASVVVSHGY